MASSFPWLTLLIFLPMAGAGALYFAKDTTARMIALAVTVAEPGFARYRATESSDRPPCGQNQAPDAAAPGASDADARGPIRSSHAIAPTRKTTDASANRACPRTGRTRGTLIERPASS